MSPESWRAGTSFLGEHRKPEGAQSHGIIVPGHMGAVARWTANGCPCERVVRTRVHACGPVRLRACMLVSSLLADTRRRSQDHSLKKTESSVESATDEEKKNSVAVDEVRCARGHARPEAEKATRVTAGVAEVLLEVHPRQPIRTEEQEPSSQRGGPGNQENI